MEQFFDFDTQSFIDRLLYLEMRHDFENRDFTVSDIMHIVDEELLVFQVRGTLPKNLDDNSVSVLCWNKDSDVVPKLVPARPQYEKLYWCFVVAIPGKCSVIKVSSVCAEITKCVQCAQIKNLDGDFSGNRIFLVEVQDHRSEICLLRKKLVGSIIVGESVESTSTLSLLYSEILPERIGN